MTKKPTPPCSPAGHPGVRTSSTPTRQCLVSKAVRPTSDLIRFALSPDGLVVPDLKARLPGRGVWVSADRDHINTAQQKNLFARGFRQTVTINGDLAQQIENQLRQDLLNRLGLARRSGEIILGHENVAKALKARQVGAYIGAHDGAEDGRNKLLRLLHATDRDIFVCGAFDSEALGLALGQENVIHGAFRPGPACQAWCRLATTLAAFCPLTPETWLRPLLSAADAQQQKIANHE